MQTTYAADDAAHDETQRIAGLEVVFRLHVLPEDIPIRGNASGMGDEGTCPEEGCHFSGHGEGLKEGSIVPGHNQGAYEVVPGEGPIRGNPESTGTPTRVLWIATENTCPGSGSPAANADEKLADWLEDRLNRGDEWAWFCARVSCVIGSPDGSTYEGTAYLGGCSYTDCADFTSPAQGVWEDLKSEAYRDALEALLRTAQEAKDARRKARTAVRLLKRLPAQLQEA